jgi:hypothetical protein
MNELSIPETKPKPRKEDVIKALVIIARQNHEAATKARKEERERLWVIYEKAVMAAFRKSPKAFNFCVNDYGGVVEVEFRAEYKSLPENVKAVKDAWQNCHPLASFDESEVKATIRAELTETTGVSDLLANVEFAENAKTFLDQIL